MLELLKVKFRPIVLYVAGMILAIFMSAFVGSLFWVPDDIDAFSQGQKELQDLKGVVMTERDLQKIMGHKNSATSQSDSPGTLKVLVNSMLWRPWLVFPFVLAMLLLLRPNMKHSILSGGVVLIALLWLGLHSSALFFCAAILVYLLAGSIRRSNRDGVDHPR